MTGQCLASERFYWHESKLMGCEADLSVHTYTDTHKNESSECIWNFLYLGSSKYYDKRK